ncbi:substrate-binding domain-containing protein [Saccharothrix obliqua]|uniref:substrate-binding domain-containing protein n=1 Tax=Saccharothrix obliqua TaxID=2861747 RepID=UPI001C5D6CF1|nr:substrate-binding domain-containing protein [Saccharothrix obliqua]MBW4721703.1 substrate-binding domain-containing protein [Saccharothrix obliqua]
MDVSGFGALDRNVQQAVRNGLYRALESAFTECGIRWDDEWDGTYHEDRGDGLFVLVPATVPNARVVSALPHVLVGELRRQNAVLPPGGAIRLRAAITSGEVLNDGNGVMGDGLVLAFRLLDCAALRDELRRRPGELALIVSDRFYRDVIDNDPACDPLSYRRVDVAVKEVRDTAWITRPDHPPAVAAPKRSWFARPVLRRLRWSLPALVVLLAAPVSCDALLATPVPTPPCPDPVQLNVLTSAEKADVVGALAVDFEDASRSFEDAGGCKQADVHVAVGPSERSVAALGRGWPDGDVAALSPEPHVWLPDTSWEVAETRQVLAAGGRDDVVLVDRGPVAHSPLVLGVTPDRARERVFQWHDLAAFRPLGPVDAADSGAGLAAAAALAHAALGVTALGGPTLGGPDVVRRLREAALRTARDPVDPCPAAGVAVLGSEKAVRDLTCLKPLYPAGGTLDLDHPFVEVRRTDRPNARREAVAGAFHAFLVDGPAQAVLRQAGFRDRGWVVAPHDDIRPKPPPELALTVDAAGVRAAWEAARALTRVVVAVDGTDRAAVFADRLTALVGEHGDVRRMTYAPADLPRVVERAVGEHGADHTVVVVVGGTPPAATTQPAVSAAQVTVLGVGFTDRPCTAADQLGAFQASYRGGCYTEPDVDRAVDRVAEGLWGAHG